MGNEQLAMLYLTVSSNKVIYLSEGRDQIDLLVS
jgi:hypothetical protein